MNQQQQPTDREKPLTVGGLWNKTSQAGKQYMQGKFTYGSQLIIVPNQFKQKDSDPDWTVMLARYVPKDQYQQQGQQNQQQQQQQQNMQHGQQQQQHPQQQQQLPQFPQNQPQQQQPVQQNPGHQDLDNIPF